MRYEDRERGIGGQPQEGAMPRVEGTAKSVQLAVDLVTRWRRLEKTTEESMLLGTALGAVTEALESDPDDRRAQLLKRRISHALASRRLSKL